MPCSWSKQTDLTLGNLHKLNLRAIYLPELVLVLDPVPYYSIPSVPVLVWSLNLPSELLRKSDDFVRTEQGVSNKRSTHFQSSFEKTCPVQFDT